MGKTYYCNCYELTGKNPDTNTRFEETEVCENKICVHCGHYALISKDHRHTAESYRFNWDSVTNLQATFDETVKDYIYAEQARREGRPYKNSGRGTYDRMELL